MLNGREGKYEGSDDSEYHFSDDEVHYDTESESAPKQAPVGDIHGGAAAGSSSGLKRMGIGLAVFFVLVFIAYKMVSPGASTPVTDITPQPAAPVAMNAPAAQPQAAQQPAAPVVSPSPAATPQAANPANMQQSAQQQPAQQQAAPQQAAQPQTAIQQMQQMSSAPQEMSANQQPIPAEQTQAPAPQNMAQTAQPPAPNNMPQVMPVQSAPPPAMAPQVQPQAMQQMQTTAEIGSATLANENARLSGQLQAEYAQRINEYQSQNKNLQDQVQTLNGRVANMETEMNQLIQTLTQQFQQAGSTTPGAAAPQAAVPVEQAGPPPRIPYSVQAIIPGRAWLRSSNGDTLTVAEGDEIKGIGRVTKIDPYDGVVEINVQGRPVTLSYGNGGSGS